MTRVIALALFLAPLTAHAEPFNPGNYKPVWTEETTRHRLAIANYALIAADVITTKAALSKNSHEANPLLRAGISAVGVNAALSLDALGRMWLVHHLAAKEGSNVPLMAIGAINTLVVVNNLEAMK